MKYKEWLYEWIENYVKISSKIRTLERYRQIVNQHIIPQLGDYEISELTPRVLQDFVRKLLMYGNIKTGRGLATNSVNSIINVLQSSIKVAYEIGLVNESVADKIKRPRCEERPIECFTLIEQKKIENAVLSSNKPYLMGIILCLYTGLRIGELLALEWCDIDFKCGILTVNKSCHDGIMDNGKFGRIIDTPKTPSSVRIIPLPEQLQFLLKKLKLHNNFPNVISTKSGYISVRTYQRNFSALLKKLNVPQRGFHTLRHTFATRALECGMDVKTLSEILGHKSPSVTLNRYVHSLIDHKKHMMNQLGKSLII